jgi:hypothetical protein
MKSEPGAAERDPPKMTRNSRDATNAIPRYVLWDRPGFCDGKTPSLSDQTISATTASRLQLSRSSTPPKRPIVRFPFIPWFLRLAACRVELSLVLIPSSG